VVLHRSVIGLARRALDVYGRGNSRHKALGAMYENFKLCPNLGCKETCFRVQQYREGKVAELFHEHVPSHRLSQDAEIDALRCLVGKFASWNGQYILHSRLNQRRGGPSQHPRFLSHVTYPEPGAIRRYFSAGNTSAWSDRVVNPGQFRQRNRGAAPNNSSKRTRKKPRAA
jgi:hypothetical protein